MTVYVGELFKCVPVGMWRWNSACHMFADTDEELHEMAARLRMKRSWFQDRGGVPHYDLTPSKRKWAIGYGAREVDLHEEAEIIRSKRNVSLHSRG